MSENRQSTDKGRENQSKISNSKKYSSRYQIEWRKQWPFIQPATGSETNFFCTVCNRQVSCAHQGIKDVERHIKSSMHESAALQLRKQPKLNFVSSTDDKVIRSEVDFTKILVQQNIPLAFADHLSRGIQKNFTDSQTAKNYSCGRTKTACILNGALAPYILENLVSRMKINPFSLAIDGSSDTDLLKMNPLTVRIFDVNKTKIVTEFLDMCATRGRDAGKAEEIFNKIDFCMEKYKIPWTNCKGFSVDNTNVNIGARNSIKSRALEKNKFICFVGCPCHMVHNTASKSASAYALKSGFDVEDFAVDLFYWFDKSTNRKGILNEFCDFHDIEYKKILKHVNVRWLSLELSIQRVLKQFCALKSYFSPSSNATGKSAPRFKRLETIFTNPMSEVNLLFMQSILPIFTNFNKFLQYDHPLIHDVHDNMISFLKNLLSRCVTINFLKNSLKDNKFEGYSDHLLPHSSIFIGFITKQKLGELKKEGMISEDEETQFYEAVKAFYMKAIDYALKTLPLNDSVLQNCKFVNFKKRLDGNFENITILIEKLGLSFTEAETQQLLDEFVAYQLLDDSNIPKKIWDEAKITDGDAEYYRMDIIWGYILKMQNVDYTLRFKQLAKVVESVLVLPHSNAAEERVFSMIRKSKTTFRSSLEIEGTLSSIITVKLATDQNFVPPPDVLSRAKKATMEYNKEHSNKK